MKLRFFKKQVLKTQSAEFRLVPPSVLLGAVAFFGGVATAAMPEQPVVFADQGVEWTPQLRALYYTQDQGSQLIPLAWLKALKQENEKPFTESALARYGYLPNPSSADAGTLPAGFSLANSQQGPMVGMTCAACHTREIEIDSISYRIDGGPAFADFQSFVVDLDAAVIRALASDEAFRSFAGAVLGADAQKPQAIAALHDSVALWSLRFHTLISQSAPRDKPWGPGRLDAIAMIYNRLNGLDLGAPPTYILADNMALGDAPARYPYLWNAGRQDKTQWGGWAANGTDGLALARNLGQVIGVFATFHPGPKTAASVLDRDYLSVNSANIAGLAMAEGILKRLEPPKWPFPIDTALAELGREIFNRPAGPAGGCAECHGLAEGEMRPPDIHTWKTEVADAGTDTRQWRVVLRSAKTGTLEGAIVPGIVGPLKATDASLNILKAVVTGTLVEIQAAQATAATPAPAAATGMTHREMDDTMRADPVPVKTDSMPAPSMPAPASPAPETARQQPVFGYEARALQGIWAAAPYLHNGSVPSLSELLKPAAQRTKEFKVGSAYDTQAIGLAAVQDTSYTLKTTGCEDRASGNSNCGHDYGTQLPEAEKKALLEYLKAL
jgi:mono/diheme cytochrome c family protein